MLKVIIQGKTCSGKSTLALALQRALTKLGVRVEVNDDDFDEIDLEEGDQVGGSRLDMLKSQFVLIETQQLNREGA
jgi:adenylylsulfate kinase-like enzyme